MASPPSFPPPYNPDPPPSGAAQEAGGYQWLAPATLPGGPEMPGPARPPTYELRPLSTGEVLDRTFSLYRSHFLMFAGISALAAAVRLVGQAVQLALQHFILKSSTPLGNMGVVLLLSLPMTFVFLLAFAISQAATVWAMAEVYLGRSATVVGSLRATGRRWLRFLGIALWQMGCAVWLPLVVIAAAVGLFFASGRSLNGFGSGALLVLAVMGAMVGSLIFYLRNLLAVPAAVREDLGVRAAMRRSKVLAQGAKGKLFLLLLISAALYFVMAIVLSTIVGIVVVLERNPHNLLAAQIVSMIVVFVGYTVISPVVMIGVALVYFDQRVRKEAFDVAVLLGDESVLGTVPVVAAVGVDAGYGTAAMPPVPPVQAGPLNGAEPGPEISPGQTAPESTLPAPEAVPGPEETLAEPPGGASGL